jgi:signal transduction histidine kinase
LAASSTRSLWSIRLRLTVYSGLLALLLLLVTWAVATIGSQSYETSHSRDILDTVSKELLEEMEPLETAEGDFPEMVEEINEATVQTSERMAVLHIKGDQVVNRSHVDAPNWPLDNSRDWMTVVLPYHGDKLVAALYFGDIQNALNHQALSFAIVLLGILPLVTLGSWKLVGAVLSPISELSRQARSVETDLTARLDPSSTDTEVVELVTTFNLFLDRLTESVELRSRFYASASHELRTPLQALSGHLELALNKERESADYRAALSEAQEQTRRLTSLTQALLTLNRLEVDSVKHYEAVDLVDYCENEWHQLKARIQAKNLMASCDLPQSIDLVTLPNYLTILIRNLLENAVKYSPDEGELRLALTKGPDDAIATLSVFNQCEPLDPTDFARLGEPFFRSEKSRQSSTRGNGLGLAICSVIAKTQGWSLEFQGQGGGFHAQVIFREKSVSKEDLS